MVLYSPVENARSKYPQIIFYGTIFGTEEVKPYPAKIQGITDLLSQQMPKS